MQKTLFVVGLLLALWLVVALGLDAALQIRPRPVLGLSGLGLVTAFVAVRAMRPRTI